MNKFEQITTRKNPTYSIRSGLTYEELWGLYFCAKWLTNPEKYENIRFQTAPDEVYVGNFYLDDIVLRTVKGLYELYQVKRRVNPERDLWNWCHFIEPKNKRGTSLFRKWSMSLSNAKQGAKNAIAAFITNGTPSAALNRYLKDNRILIEEIQKHDASLFKAVEKEVGAHSLTDFFQSFEFRFDQDDLSQIEEKTDKILLNEAKATRAGINSLKLQLEKEFARKKPVPISLRELREWCQFDDPRPLNQEFEVPDDFQLFDESQHNALLKQLKTTDGGIKVIVGKPGSGKSTYLSKLHKVITDEGMVSIRHHYHLSTDESNPAERVDYGRVVETLKRQYKEHSELIGALAHQNSGQISLSEYIDAAAQASHSKGTSHVVIIDGLDHALRSNDKEKLEQCLREVCRPQPGLWTILGMQDIARQHLPENVYQREPEGRWLHINGLGFEGIEEIVIANKQALVLPTNPIQLKSVVKKLFEVTQGNPLHLRYTLRELKNLNQANQVSEYDVEKLLPYDSDIANYYSALWRQLPSVSKSMLLALKLMDESIRQTELYDFSRFIVKSPSQVSEGYTSIAHLTVERRNGLSLFHNSLQVFIGEQPEWQQQLPVLTERLRDWLVSSQYDHLKWSQLPILNWRLGDSSLLLSLDRKWLVEAVKNRRTPKSIERQLSLAAEIAFKEGKFGKCFTFNSLSRYYGNAERFQEEISDRIWSIALNVDKPPASTIRLSGLRPAQLKAIAALASNQGGIDVVLNETIDALNDRHRDQEVIKKGQFGGALPILTNTIVEVISLSYDHDVKHVVEYLTEFRGSGWTPELIASYVKSLCKNHQLSKIQELLALKPEKDEIRTVLEQCVIYDISDHKREFFQAVKSHLAESRSLLLELYLVLQEEALPSLPELPLYDDFPKTVPEFDTRKRQERANLFYECFIRGIIYAYSGKSDLIQEWMKQVPQHWSMQIATQLHIAGAILGQSLRKEQPLSVELVLERLSRIRPLKWPENRDQLELQNALQVAILSIIEIIQILNEHLGQSTYIDHKSLLMTAPREYLNKHQLIEVLVRNDIPFLSEDSYRNFLAQEKKEMLESLETFPERAGRYCDLAHLAHIHNDTESSVYFLSCAVDNFLGYGWRKDRFLAEVLEAIQICNKYGSRKTTDWVHRIGPPARYILEYTDGDDVGDIPSSLGEVLASVNRQLLLSYYSYMAGDEQLSLAEDLFRYVIRALDYGNPIDRAVASTGIHEETYEELKSRAQNCQGARESLKNIQEYFGDIRFPKTDHTTSYDLEQPDSDVIKKTTPDKLEATLREQVESRNQRDFLRVWGQHWLNQDIKSSRAAYRALNSLIHRDNLSQEEPVLLDMVASVDSKYNRGQAFELLCWAQANDSGWATYWSDKERAKERWVLIERRFSTRALEFFRKSIERTGVRYGNKSSYFVPIPRGVEFLAMFGHIDLCEEITEAAVSSVQSLMADIKFPTCDWLDDTNIDTLDILIERLTWPGPYVRERTATAIGHLLQDKAIQEGLFARLLQWLSRQELQTLVNIGLLPILKAAECPKSLESLPLEKLAQSIKVTSPVITELLLELKLLIGCKIVPTNETKRNVVLDEVSEPSPFFIKYSRSFVAPFYTLRAEDIKGMTGHDFKKCWANWSKELMTMMACHEDVGDVMNFVGGRSRPILTGLSTRISEIYRTAFLDILAAFNAEGYLSDEEYKSLSFKTMPIDLSYWKISPGRLPSWWPQLAMNEPLSQETEKIISLNYKTKLEDLLNGVDDNYILGLDGTVENQSSWIDERGPSTNLQIIAFGYKVDGPSIPPAEIVSNQLIGKGPVRRFSSIKNKCRPLNFLESSVEQEEYPTGSVRIGDLRCYPLIARNRDEVINLWQFFRDYRLFSLSNDLMNGVCVKLTGSQWQYHRDGTCIAIGGDWLDGLAERSFSDLHLPFGCYSLASKEFITDYLKSKKLRLGFVSKSEYRVKKSTFDEAETFVQYKLYNVSPIIV